MDVLLRWHRLATAAVVFIGVTFGLWRTHGPLDTPQGLLPAKSRDRLRVVTWNLRNFEGDPTDHDLAWMRQHIDRIGPDVIALQEIREPSALASLLPGYVVHASPTGGRHHQHVAIAFDPETITLVSGPVEDRSFTAGGQVRPAWLATLRRRDGTPFDVLVVHLKATPDGYALREQQWTRIVAATQGKPTAIVLGDFNATGPRDAGPAQELDALDRVLAQASLTRLPTVGGCTAYWHGVRYDDWVEPSALDLIALGPAWHTATPVETWPLSHCARHRCRPFRSSEHEPERSLARGSDHCPVVVDLPATGPHPL